MKSKLKFVYKVVGFLAFLVVLALVLSIPAVERSVVKVTGIAQDKLRSVVRVVAGAGLGLMLVSLGVTALAAIPVAGMLLIVIGLFTLWYAVEPLLKPTMKVTGGQSFGIGQR